MNGIAFLKAVRAQNTQDPLHPLYRKRAREEVVIQAINEGADFYLQKGGDIEAQFASCCIQDYASACRRSAEMAAEKSNRQLAGIFSHLPDPTFAIDKDGIILAWNRAMEDFTGAATADMLGKGEYEYAVPFYGTRRPVLVDLILHPELGIPDNYAILEKSSGVLIAETDLLNGNGEIRTAWAKATPLYDAEGRITGAVETVRDVTVQKKMEEDLRKSEEQYRSVIENIQDVFYRTDLAGNLLIASPSWAELLGYDSVDDCIGKKIADEFYFYPRERQAFLEGGRGVGCGYRL
jgi:PAS domain-containing protein